MTQHDPALIWTPEQRQTAHFCVGMRLAICAAGGSEQLSLENVAELLRLYQTLAQGASGRLDQTDLINLYALMLDPQHLLEALEAGELSTAQVITTQEAAQWTASGLGTDVPGTLPTIESLCSARLACLHACDPRRARTVTLSPETTHTLGGLIASRIELAQAAGIAGGPAFRILTSLLSAVMRAPVTLDAEEAAESLELLLEHARFQMISSERERPECGVAQAITECMTAGWPSTLPHPLETQPAIQ